MSMPRATILLLLLTSILRRGNCKAVSVSLPGENSIEQAAAGYSDVIKRLQCCLLEIKVQLEDAFDDGPQSALTEYQCETHPDDEPDHVSGRTYDITVPSDITSTHRISLGTVCLSIPNAVRDMTQMTIHIPDPDLVTVIDMPQHHRDRRHRRAEGRSIGVSTLLMLIVNNVQGNTQNITDKSHLSELVFGTAGTTFSTIYSQCSGGALQWNPASGEGIVGGVGEMTIDAVIEPSTNRSVIANLVKEAATAKFGDFSNASTGIDHGKGIALRTK
jgi:hypothetical protein